MAKKKAAPPARFRDTTTDDAIVQLVADHGGEVDHRVILRKLGHRADLRAAFGRLDRRGAIELVFQRVRGHRQIQRVRLLGDTAIQHGAGMIRVGGVK